jgi:hypothetical protein
MPDGYCWPHSPYAEKYYCQHEGCRVASKHSTFKWCSSHRPPVDRVASARIEAAKLYDRAREHDRVNVVLYRIAQALHDQLTTT